MGIKLRDIKERVISSLLRRVEQRPEWQLYEGLHLGTVKIEIDDPTGTGVSKVAVPPIAENRIWTNVELANDNLYRGGIGVSFENVGGKSQQRQLQTEVLNRVVKFIWDREDANYYLTEVGRDISLFGIGFLELFVDSDIRIRPLSPYLVFPDDASDIEDMEYIAIAQNLPISKSKRIAVGDIKYTVWDERLQMPEIPQSPFVSDVFRKVTVADSSGQQEVVRSVGKRHHSKIEDMVTHVVYYGKVDKGEWQKVEILGDTLISDVNIRVTTPPIAPLWYRRKTGQFYGISEVGLVANQQLSIYKREYQAQTLFDLSNPILHIPESAGIDPSKLFTRQGNFFVVKERGEPIKITFPPVVNPQLLQMNLLAKQELDQSMSSPPVLRGITPERVESSVAIQSIKGQAQVPLEAKKKALTLGLKRAVKILWRMIVKNYDVNRLRAITGLDLPDDFELPNPDDDTINVVIQIHEGRPFEKVVDLNTHFQLFSAGIIDAEELLNRIEYPDRDKIIEKLRQRQQQAAQALQQVQQQGGATNEQLQALGL